MKYYCTLDKIRMLVKILETKYKKRYQINDKHNSVNNYCENNPFILYRFIRL